MTLVKPGLSEIMAVKIMAKIFNFGHETKTGIEIDLSALLNCFVNPFTNNAGVKSLKHLTPVQNSQRHYYLLL